MGGRSSRGSQQCCEVFHHEVIQFNPRQEWGERSEVRK